MSIKLREYRFPPHMIQTKPGRGSSGPLSFVDVRHIAQALDELTSYWDSHTRIEYIDAQNQFIAIVKLEVFEEPQATLKEDVGAGETVFDAQNQAFRRCAAQHGLGAYLWTGEAPQKPQEAPQSPVQAYGWSSDPAAVIFADTHKDTFADKGEAIAWGVAMKVFNHARHAQNSYDKAMKETPPSSRTEAWKTWIEKVAEKVNTAKDQPPTDENLEQMEDIPF